MKTKLLILILSVILLSCGGGVKVKTFDNNVIDGVRNPHCYNTGDTVIVACRKHTADKCIYDGPIYWRDTTFHQDTYDTYVKGVIIK